VTRARLEGSDCDVSNKTVVPLPLIYRFLNPIPSGDHMKRLVILFIMAALILAACTQDKSPVGVATTLAQKLAAAYDARSAKAYLALFSDDAMYVDYGMHVGPMKMKVLESEIDSAFADKNFAFKLKPSFVSDDGRFATLRGDFSNLGHDGAIQTVPALVVLEIKNGKIISEADYYDGEPYLIAR
jgi:hypothetical protein